MKTVPLNRVLKLMRRPRDAEKVANCFGHKRGTKARSWAREAANRDNLETGERSPMQRALDHIVAEYEANPETAYAIAYWFNYSFWLYAIEKQKPLHDLEAATLISEVCKESLAVVFDDLSPEEKRLKLLCQVSRFYIVIAGTDETDEPAAQALAA